MIEKGLRKIAEETGPLTFDPEYARIEIESTDDGGFRVTAVRRLDSDPLGEEV